jgi:hypothetical protein
MNELVPMHSDFDVLERWGKLAKEAGILPKEVNVAQAALMVQAGRELGLPPCQSLRSFYIVNGRLAMKVELQLALARKVGVKIGRLEEQNDYCEVTLVRGEESVTTRFSDADAKRAGLLDQGFSWARYPREMRRWRAIGAALRLIAPDVVLGLLSPEEAESIPPLDAEPEAMEQVAKPTEASEPEAMEQVAKPTEASEPHGNGNVSPEELKAKLAELGFTRPEAIALRAKIKEVGADPRDAAVVVMSASSKAEAVQALRTLGIRFS